MIRNLTRHLFGQQKSFISVRYKTSVSEKMIEDLSVLELNEAVEEDDHLREAEIEKKRNKSRLYSQHRNMLHNKMPYDKPFNDFHHTVKYQRKLYARFGESSGVHAGICWPTGEELRDIQEYERLAYPQSLQTMISAAITQRSEINAKQHKRQEDIAKKVVKLEQWKTDLKEKIAKREAEAMAVKERKDRLIEEVRRHFGFKIDPRDERFKEMLDQKERAEKKALKEAKRKVKEARMIAKLQEQKNTTATPSVETIDK
ncbi:CR6-interacting factor [Carabus blaptoides fortunei]